MGIWASIFGQKSRISQPAHSLRRSRARNKQRLAIELLEDRWVPSGVNPNEIINTALTPTQLAQSLVGAGVTVNNVQFTGGSASTGSFSFTDPTVVGFGQGILLSSGSAADVVGPNLSDWTSTDFGLPGDPQLDALSGFTTYDAAVLEFDFVPTANQVVFNYTFASDEYPEWVATPYNDTFAFFVNGTNYANVRQVAGDPNSPFVPVAVNNINNSNPVLTPPPTAMRSDLFTANYYAGMGPSAKDLELDGITHVLTFQAPVNPGVVNHMKLAIADASDGIYDSAVFIQAGSLISNQNPVADLSLTPSNGAAPLAVKAIVEAEDPNGLALTYTINWGDGTVSTGALTDPVNSNEKTTLVDHTYNSAGNYFVTLTVSNGTLIGTSTEDVNVTGGGGGSVDSAPVITLNPADQFVFEGDYFTFTAAADGTPAPAVQWQISTDGGLTFYDIAGATDASYSAFASLSDNGNMYHAVFTNSEGDAATTAAALWVTPLDTTPPDAPIVSLAQDTGSSATDLITQVGALNVDGIEDGAFVEYSTDGGSTWSDSFFAAEGANNVLVHQIDAAGNVSDSAMIDFTLDTTLPAAPLVTLQVDSGSSATDLVTNVGNLDVKGTEANAIVEFSIDGGATWNDSFHAIEGLNSVQVRQTDLAGNVGVAANFSFTLDTAAPTLNPTFSTTLPILVNAAGITVSPNASDPYGIASQSGGAVNTATAGSKFVTCTATDLAGNSVTMNVPYVVGYKAVNFLPGAGATYKKSATISISFQLADANGLISDATANNLLPNIKLTFDGKAITGLKYNAKTNTFSASYKLGGASSGTHQLALAVMVDGIAATTLNTPIIVL